MIKLSEENSSQELRIQQLLKVHHQYKVFAIVLPF